MLTISTVNVNGLRAAVRKGFTAWLDATDADVVCLQEVRATPDQLPPEVLRPAGWHTYHAPAEAKGRAGVAVYTREAPEAVRVGFDTPEFAASGRYLEVDLPDVTVASLYLPSGEVATERQAEKERFMAAFLPYLAARRTAVESVGRSMVVCGDWNIAHREVDLKNWRSNRTCSGFLPEERAWLTEVFDGAGWVDVVRRLNPEGPGPYTWWTYRGRAFDNDAGWRIDYHVSTPRLAERAVKATVERAATHDERWSDHAPVTVVYDV
ncbi:exodeoxyribonuclease III [Allostreptomyces psammosilenae]|uniref:Exodeoxyribonuclease-3 n=1 Tax=Allostreptomyces psammosilenae TaxID=1892865 RepID=A0A852ZRB6_9ACTN|nr:exodeoxyribonuclease III [Allostreptomyces psammosilenae]NYI04305.1 exodeoxyribonuclease-3 [Allostreptomyces psammosilenae]